MSIVTVQQDMEQNQIHRKATTSKPRIAGASLASREGSCAKKLETRTIMPTYLNPQASPEYEKDRDKRAMCHHTKKIATDWYPLNVSWCQFLHPSILTDIHTCIYVV